jgi:hypothetical protein
VAEAFQTYIDMVTGVTKTTQARATATARTLLKQAGLEDVAAEASERVTKLAEEIMSASRANRELMQRFVTAEVDKAAARLGFARAEEVQALRDEVASLRLDINEAKADAVKAATAKTAPAKKAPTKKAPAKKASAKKASAKKVPPRKAVATMTPTKKATATSARRKPRKTAATAESRSPGEK